MLSSSTRLPRRTNGTIDSTADFTNDRSATFLSGSTGVGTAITNTSPSQGVVWAHQVAPHLGIREQVVQLLLLDEQRALVDGANEVLADVHADHGMARARPHERGRQPHVAGPDDDDLRLHCPWSSP